MSYPRRYSGAPPQAPPRPVARSMTCNKCQKDLTTTVFVCSCCCCFCEDCTYSHFETSSKCPSCFKQLKASDFLELVVANSTAATDLQQQAFQSLFTKATPNSADQSFQDVCHRILESMEYEDRIIRFMLHQLVLDSRRNGQHSEDLVQAKQSAEDKVAQLKQAINTQKIQNERTIEDLQRKVQALELLDQEQRNNISQLDTQLHQLSQLQDYDNVSLSHSQGSHGSQGSTGVPPMHGFTIPEQSRGRSLKQRSSGQSIFAPVGQPYQRHPRNSPGSGGGQRPLQHRASRSNSPPRSARRAVSNGENFSAGSGYVFSIRNNARPQNKSPGAYQPSGRSTAPYRRC